MNQTQGNPFPAFFNHPDEALELLKTLLSHSLEGVAVTDLKANILWVNPAFTRITGYPFEEIQGKNPRILKSGRHAPDYYQEMWRSLRSQGFWEGDIFNRRKNGEVYPEFLKIQTLKDRDGKPYGYAAILNDTTHLKAFEQNMNAQLSLARKIQNHLLPGGLPKGFESVLSAALYLPMEQVGGDFYDLIRVPHTGFLGIFISDIAGHGVPAALICSMVKTLLESSDNCQKQKPAALFTLMNQQLSRLSHESFLTAFYGVYNPDSRKLIYARAGHPYPVIIRNHELIFLDAQGSLMLGVFEDLTFYEHEIELFSGDRIVFYTDGIIEAVNDRGEDFEENFYELLKTRNFQSCHEIVQAVHRELVRFTDRCSFEDDVCLFALEIH